MRPVGLKPDLPKADCIRGATGIVVDGTFVVEDISLPERSVVTVLARGLDEPFTLSPQDEEELLAAMAEIERGEFVSADELIESLGKYG